MSLQALSKVTPLIAKVVEGENLTVEESEKVFTSVILNDIDGYHFTALLSAIHAKGETVDEMKGIINTFRALSETININTDINKTIDVSGTGGGSFKTINVSTAVAFVLAAAGFIVPKASYYSVTNSTGSADIFLHFGLDIATLTKKQIEQALKTVGICPFYTPFISPKLENRGRLYKKVYKDHQLAVKGPGHVMTNAFSPFPIKYRIYGCYSEKYLEKLAHLFADLGYGRTLTFYAEIGMPEISNVGKTIIFEQNGKAIEKKTYVSEDFGVVPAKEADISSGSKEQNIQDFIDILKGINMDAKSDLVAINAGAAFYALNDVTSIAEGTKKAKEILKSGAGYQKLEELSEFVLK